MVEKETSNTASALMTETQIDSYIKTVNTSIKHILKSPKASRDLLVNSGICTLSGELTKNYK